jgi:HK97 family phage portal protein
MATSLWPRWGGTGPGSVFTQLVLPGSRYDYATEAGDLWKNPVIALGLKWIHDRASKPRIRLSRIRRDGSYEPVANDPVTALWNRPNAHYYRRTLEAGTVLSLVCGGTGYIHKRRSGSGDVAELWWLPETQVTPQWPADGSAFIDGWLVSTKDGAPMPVPYEDIIQFRTGIDPDNPRLGFSPVKACLREVCAVNEEASYVASLLRNSGVPSVAIIPLDPNVEPNEDDARSIKRRFKNTFSGEGRGEPIVFQGKYDIKVIGYSPEQLALHILPQNAIGKVAAAVGVPPMVMGLPDPNADYSNMANLTRSAWSVITAAQDVIAETLRWSLLPEFNLDPQRYVVEYDYTGINELAEPLDALHTRVRENWKAGLYRLNVALEELGLDPEPDGDRFYPGTGGGEMLPLDPTQDQNQTVPDPSLNGDGAKGWRY